MLLIWTKTLARENRMAQRLATASKLTFAKKYRIYDNTASKLTFAKKYSIYDNKHSGSIQIKEQYSPGQLSLPKTPMAFFLECQTVH